MAQPKLRKEILALILFKASAMVLLYCACFGAAEPPLADVERHLAGAASPSQAR